MKRWAILVAVLYLLALLALTLPVTWLAFVPNMKANEILGLFISWPYWAWLAVMGLSQFCLLIVPVKLAAGRPTSQRSLLWSILSGGLLAGCLVAGALSSISEFIFRDGAFKELSNWRYWLPWAVGGLAWIVWGVVFFRLTREQSADNAVRQQCRWLLRGSILELLIAVPTHIVARYRNYCCAGFMTFIGLTFGIAVMLFAYGPAVFFLFAERWKRLHPKP